MVVEPVDLADHIVLKRLIQVPLVVQAVVAADLELKSLHRRRQQLQVLLLLQMQAEMVPENRPTIPLAQRNAHHSVVAVVAVELCLQERMQPRVALIQVPQEV
jgi:hypothetical protein